MPNVERGDLISVYVPAPVGAIVGSLTVEELVAESPERLWRCVGKVSGLTRKEFLAYFEGVDVGFAIRVTRGERLPKPISRATLQVAHPHFRPPQGYIYLKADRDANHPLRRLLVAA